MFLTILICAQVEASAYKYNNMINQLELYKPEFSKLRVRESGFARRDTEDVSSNHCKVIVGYTFFLFRKSIGFKKC